MGFVLSYERSELVGGITPHYGARRRHALEALNTTRISGYTGLRREPKTALLLTGAALERGRTLEM